MFFQKNRTPETICEAEIIMFVMLYYEKDSDSLTDLRYLKCMKITPSSRTIKPQNLLPIEQAIMLHVYWVHFQL